MQNKTRQDRNLSTTIYLGKLRLLEKKVREYWFCLFKKLPKSFIKVEKEYIFVMIFCIKEKL